jgi:DNA-binding NarL/FixJ family response regulator
LVILYRAAFMFRVMIVDDQIAMRRMVQRILEPERDFEVVGEATNGAEAVSLVNTLCLDGIIMDVQMPRMDGFEAARLILARHPQLAIVLTSMNDDMEYLRLAREIGATGLIPKINLNAIILRQVLINGATPLA